MGSRPQSGTSAAEVGLDLHERWSVLAGTEDSDIECADTTLSRSTILASPEFSNPDQHGRGRFNFRVKHRPGDRSSLPGADQTRPAGRLAIGCDCGRARVRRVDRWIASEFRIIPRQPGRDLTVFRMYSSSPVRWSCSGLLDFALSAPFQPDRLSPPPPGSGDRSWHNRFRSRWSLRSSRGPCSGRTPWKMSESTSPTRRSCRRRSRSNRTRCFDDCHGCCPEWLRAGGDLAITIRPGGWRPGTGCRKTVVRSCSVAADVLFSF